MILVELGCLVEEDRSTALALELDEDHVLAVRHSQDFELDVSLLKDGNEGGSVLFSFLLRGSFIDLLSDFDVDTPMSIGNDRFLADLVHLFEQVLHDNIRLVG